MDSGTPDILKSEKNGVLANWPLFWTFLTVFPILAKMAFLTFKRHFFTVLAIFPILAILAIFEKPCFKMTPLFAVLKPHPSSSYFTPKIHFLRGSKIGVWTPFLDPFFDPFWPLLMVRALCLSDCLTNNSIFSPSPNPCQKGVQKGSFWPLFWPLFWPPFWTIWPKYPRRVTYLGRYLSGGGQKGGPKMTQNVSFSDILRSKKVDHKICQEMWKTPKWQN